jgi:hypothetical protein
MDLSVFNQLLFLFVLLVPIILIGRTVVAGTRYSPILIIVIFGLAMGFLMVKSNMGTPGLPEFPLVIFMSKVTVIVLIASFFVGGQELRKIFLKHHLDIEQLVTESQEEILLGTKRTQLVYILRSIFILLGIAGANKLLIGASQTDPLAPAYPLLTYIGATGSVMLIDSRAQITDKPQYLRRGLIEMVTLLAVLFASHHLAQWIKPIIGLPQIFFAMVLSATLGFAGSNWRFGPTIKALLFAGIPVVLAANFLIGGSSIGEAFKLTGMKEVMGYGFFGQLFWMFGGLALLILFGKANHVRNLAPGMAGALSHSGLTGACTAGDLGQAAAARAPVMINIPFFGHIFVFSVLAFSARQGTLTMGWSALIVLIGIVLTLASFWVLRKANGREDEEVKGLMLFSFGWQLTAVFGSFVILALSGMSIGNAGMAVSAALSHFGLFAATQSGMFGEQAANLIPFIFAMPFLVHPLVFGIFGKAMQHDGVMPVKVTYPLAATGLLGLIACLILF